jgi:hypothetical protein
VSDETRKKVSFFSDNYISQEKLERLIHLGIKRSGVSVLVTNSDT